MKKRNSVREIEVPPKASALVVYETSIARERAIGFSESFSGQAIERPVINWYSFEDLTIPTRAEKAVTDAIIVDVIAFAFHSSGELSVAVKLWSEKWLNGRAGRGGFLVGLVLEDGAHPRGVSSLKEIYLRQLANRTGMDYLSHFPARTIRTLPDSLDSFTQRAERITPLLAGILNTRPAPRLLPFK